MTQGVVLFAFNNERFDYVSMARWSAARINRHLDLPVTLITDSRPADASAFDRIIVVDQHTGGSRYFQDVDATVTWKNTSRPMVYDLSPYDQTLLLDVDYVVCSSTLKQLFQSQQDILCHRRAFDVTGVRDYISMNHFGKFNMPMSWATVIYFRKSSFSQHVFGMMSMIQQHWAHYVRLYGLGRSTYRNDHALSIALSTTHGHTLDYPGIPWSLATVDPEHTIELDADRFKIDFVTTDKKSRYIYTNSMDLHVMGKASLEKIIADTR